MMSRCLFLLLLIPAMAFGQATIDSSSVCDTCDYTTWLAWESGEDDTGDLVGDDRALVGYRQDDSATTSHLNGVQLSGFTTDPTRDITMVVPQTLKGYHNGIADTTGKFYMTDNSLRALQIAEGFVAVDGFYLIETSSNNSRAVLQTLTTDANFDITARNCILDYASTGVSFCINLDPFSNAGRINVVNNLLIIGNAGVGIEIDDVSCTLYVYNNTFVNNTIGTKNGLVAFRWDGVNNDNASRIYNNIFIDVDSVYEAQDAVDFSDFNSFDDDTWGDNYSAGSDDNENQTFTFKDSANKDFRLASNDAGALDLGTNLSSDSDFPFPDDVVGQVRPTTWDIGFFEDIPLWKRQVEIQISNTNVDATLTDFPVLLTADNFPSEMFDPDDSDRAANGGGDLRFFSDSAAGSGDSIACSVVDFKHATPSASGDAQVYVDIASLLHDATTSVWCQYGKLDAVQAPRNAAYGSENVWKADYNLVCPHSSLEYLCRIWRNMLVT